ncbi:MAG: major capsid protein [Arizlama microvirus]|nr:MAG: major capsid protein [Arizlama microvirus]
MRLTEGYTQPLPTMKSTRPDEWRGLTSVRAGVMTPIAFVPLLREDRIRANCTVQVSSDETLKVIVNPVRVRVEAFLIPKTVLERFQGSMEVLNRAYMNEPAPSGMGTTPAWYLASPPFPANDTGHELFDKLGIHWKGGAVYNTDLVESYNQLHNWMRKNVSPGLPLVALNNTTCLPAFWESWRFAEIKPSFDAAQMEGQVPIQIDAGKVPLRNFGAQTTNGTGTGNVNFTNGQGQTVTVDGANMRPAYWQPGSNNTPPFADMSAVPGTISLENIKTAEKAQVMAMMRDRYKSVPDEYLIDILMSGIEIPDADLRQPIRLATAEAVIGQTERYATDGASLDTSVSNGMAMVDFTINTPPVNTGGIVLVVLSIVPEQLYERIEDIALAVGDGTKDATKTPQYVSDYLDPQKVEAVPNSFVDVLHTDPTGIFGYAPLNYQWRRSFSRVGGKFKRPVPDAFVEDRQRIWSVEKTDPELSADFYLCPSPFPHTVFADQDADPYEVITVLQASIVGNTVFGPGFDEDMGSYDRIIAEVDQTRLTGDPVVDAVVLDAEPEETAEA